MLQIFHTVGSFTGQFSCVRLCAVVCEAGEKEMTKNCPSSREVMFAAQ